MLEDYGLDVNAIAAYVGDDTRAWIQLAVADERASKRLGRPSIDGGNDAQPQSVQDLTKAFDQFVPSLIALKRMQYFPASKTLVSNSRQTLSSPLQRPSRRFCSPYGMPVQNSQADVVQAFESRTRTS